MNFEKKTNMASAAAILLIALICIFVLNYLLGQIEKQTNDFILQKSRLVELESRENNLQSFRENRKEYQPSLAKIGNLFINATEPVGFIEFLEREAVDSGLIIEITPFSSQKLEADFWPSMNFRLALAGDFSSLLGFLEKLENSSYLLEVSSLNIRQVAAKESAFNGIDATLLLKVYSK